MSAAGHPENGRPRAATALADAEFVRLVGTADGDALAAAGLLTSALEAIGTPYQVSLAAVPDPPATDADCTVALGHSGGDVTLAADALAVEAADAVAEFSPEALDPELALAGAVCAGVEPSGRLLEAADLTRRPGVAIPTDDPIEGLAGSTLVHAPFSADGRAVQDALGAFDDPDGRTLASVLALSAIENAPPRAAEAVERALHPYVTERFETLGGFADVLDAVARVEPGTGIALALGLRDFADSIEGREQLAIEAFADAVDVIPRTLAENAGLDPIDSLVELRSRQADDSTAGLDAYTGDVIDMESEGVVEPLRIKTQAIESATEAAVMILRIDDVIAAGDLKGGSSDDDDDEAPGGPGGAGGMGGMGGMGGGMGGMM